MVQIRHREQEEHGAIAVAFFICTLLLSNHDRGGALQ
jgi:hypothetical protein